MKCRFCHKELFHRFVDLKNSPPSNSFLTENELNEPEQYYPLRVFVCDKCFLVQIAEYKKFNDIFNNEYVYFSSLSRTWLEHAKKYVKMITDRLKLTSQSKVIEIASNDGYLLQYFLERQIPCLGIEPTANTANAAREKGIKTVKAFFNTDFAKSYIKHNKKADLIIGNNVLAHVPDINNFVFALKTVLTENGSITMEFPHLMQLIEHSQFDTIYHEHFSYLSLYTACLIFKKTGLRIYDVEELPTHGGSLRVYACHKNDKQKEEMTAVSKLLEKEKQHGLLDLFTYQSFRDKKPLFFLVENVSGMLASRHSEALEGIKRLFRESGYVLSFKLLNARDFRVPQDRKRLFFVGYREDLGLKFEFPDGFEERVYLKDAIWDIRNSAIPAREKNYTNGDACSLDNHEYAIGGFSSMFMSRNRVRGWDELSFTIQAGGRHAPLHPQAPKMELIAKDKRRFVEGKERLYRRLSVRECARVQSFPDEYKFYYKNVMAGYKMVGNAVPVNLGYYLAKRIFEDLTFCVSFS